MFVGVPTTPPKGLRRALETSISTSPASRNSYSERVKRSVCAVSSPSLNPSSSRTLTYTVVQSQRAGPKWSSGLKADGTNGLGQTAGINEERTRTLSDHRNAIKEAENSRRTAHARTTLRAETRLRPTRADLTSPADRKPRELEGGTLSDGTDES